MNYDTHSQLKLFKSSLATALLTFIIIIVTHMLTIPKPKYFTVSFVLLDSVLLWLDILSQLCSSLHLLS